MMKRNLLLGLVLIGLALTPTAVSAGTLTFDATNTISGTGSTGSLTATFTDVSGGVQLVIHSSLSTNPGKMDQENLDPGKALYLNISNLSELSVLKFTLTANTNFSQAASVQTGASSFKADGTGGFFDILFTYSSSTKAFENGESQTYLISTTDNSTITADMFTSELSDSKATGKQDTGYLAAIHVQNTKDDTDSGWEAPSLGDPGSIVPEPSSMVLMGLGGFGLAGFFYRFRRQLIA